MKQTLLKMLKPRNKVIILIDILAIPLTIYALKALSSTSPVSVIAYVFSAYALTVTVVNFRRLVHRTKELVTGDELALVRGIKSIMRKNQYTKRYLESTDFRAEVALYIGLAINMVFAGYKGIYGIITNSAWVFSIGVYYLFLAVIRFVMMLNVQRRNHSEHKGIDRKLHEYRTYRLSGCMVMVLNLAVMGMAIQMIWQNQANRYSRSAVIISATYTFYCFISSVANVVSFRRRNNAILTAAKDLNMIGAAVSMYSLQTSMLYAFSSGNDEHFRRMMNTVTGIAVSVIVLGIATVMIIFGTKQIRQLEQERNETK